MRTRAELQRLAAISAKHRQKGPGVLTIAFDRVGWVAQRELGRLKLSPATHAQVLQLIEEADRITGSFVLREAGRFRIVTSESAPTPTR